MQAAAAAATNANGAAAGELCFASQLADQSCRSFLLEKFDQPSVHHVFMGCAAAAAATG